MKLSPVLIFVALVGLFVSSPALAASKKKASPPPQNQPPTIAAVTANSVTVTENNSSRTFLITQFTEIIVNGRKATIADLKPGMTASITIGTDSTKLSRINAMGK